MKKLCLYLVIILVVNALQFNQYLQMERETPEVMFTEHLDNPQHENFPQLQKLMFITPWSKEGPQLALKYAKKLDYISPCWYDLTFSADHIIIENDKLYDKTFIEQLRLANPKIKILPRFYIASNQQALIHTIGSFESKFKQAINLIIRIVETQKFDGLVFDTPFNTFHAGQKFIGMRNLILQFVNSIKMNIPKEKLLFYNMANPMGLNLATQRYAILNVDYILIQNYDNDQYFEMIDSAIKWAQNTKIQSKPQFMFLLPYFSRRKGQGVDTKQIKKLYTTQDSEMGSAVDKDICVFFEYKRRVQSYSPCLTYFKKAFEKVKDSGFESVGFWEGGNGIETYYQFL